MRTRSRMASAIGPGIRADRRSGTADPRTRADASAGADAHPGRAVPHLAAATLRTKSALLPTGRTLRRTTTADQASGQAAIVVQRPRTVSLMPPRIRFAPLRDTRSGALWPEVPPEQTPCHPPAHGPGDPAVPARTAGDRASDRPRPGRADGRSVARGDHARRTRTWN